MAVSPSDGVTPPEAKPPKLTTPKPAQVAKLIAAADENRRALLSVAAATRMRRGEVLGLRWADVEGDSVNVRGSLQRMGGELRLVEPKSSRGYRMIPLPPSVSALLRHHRKEQAKRRLICGEAWADNDYIFDSGAGQALDPDNVSHAFHRAATKAGLAGVRLHDLRHAFCTQLVEAGVAASIVSQGGRPREPRLHAFHLRPPRRGSGAPGCRRDGSCVGQRLGKVIGPRQGFAGFRPGRNRS
jgi:integrase